MSHTSKANEGRVISAKPGPPPAIAPEIAYRTGAITAKNNQHPDYESAVKEFTDRYGDRQLKAFEQGYYDGSCGWA